MAARLHESRTLPLADRMAITDLVSRYNHAIDSGDPDGVASCFTEDGCFEGRSGRFRGFDELRKLGMTASPSLIPRHIVSNSLISPDHDDPSRASIRSHLLYYEITPEGFHFKTSGVYSDRVVRLDGAWKFEHRVMTLDVCK